LNVSKTPAIFLRPRRLPHYQTKQKLGVDGKTLIWEKEKTGHTQQSSSIISHSGYDLSRQLFKEEPDFFKKLVSVCYAKPDLWGVVRINLAVDTNFNFLKTIGEAAKRKIYNSFGKLSQNLVFKTKFWGDFC
jgi:hypothetical protein